MVARLVDGGAGRSVRGDDPRRRVRPAAAGHPDRRHDRRRRVRAGADVAGPARRRHHAARRARRGDRRRGGRRRPGHRRRDAARLSPAAAVHARRAVRPAERRPHRCRRLDRSRRDGGLDRAAGRGGLRVRSTSRPKRTPASCSVGSLPRATGSPTLAARPARPSSPTGDAWSPTATSRPPAGHRSRPGHPRADRRGRPRGAADRWPRLAGWIDDDRRWLHPIAAPRRRGAGVGRAGTGRRPTRTGGPAWRQRSRRSTTGGPSPTLEREFVDAGRHARDSELRAARRSARRLRRLARRRRAPLLVVALVAGGLRR